MSQNVLHLISQRCCTSVHTLNTMEQPVVCKAARAPRTVEVCPSFITLLNSPCFTLLYLLLFWYFRGACPSMPLHFQQLGQLISLEALVNTPNSVTRQPSHRA